MELASTTLTVLFEDPFWVGLWERVDGEGYSVCRTVFGAEPRDFEVYALVLTGWRGLRFSPPVAADSAASAKASGAKRMRRQARQATRAAGMGTKAQQALKLQQEQGKQARQTRTRRQREAEQERKFALRQEKRREKHRGR